MPRIIKNSGLYIELNDECNTTSNDHEGTADKANSANWFRLTFLGRNMTTLEAMPFAQSKREYLHKYISVRYGHKLGERGLNTETHKMHWHKMFR